jgi:hypothetical protein
MYIAYFPVTSHGLIPVSRVCTVAVMRRGLLGFSTNIEHQTESKFFELYPRPSVRLDRQPAIAVEFVVFWRQALIKCV